MSVTSEQDKPSDGDPEKDLRAMQDELRQVGIDPPGDEPPDADDMGDDDSDADDGQSCEMELSNAFSQAKSMYAHETKRLELLTAFLDGMCPGIGQPIPVDAREVSQEGMTDNVTYARERAIIGVLREVRKIAKRSDLVLYASHVFALGCTAKADRNSQGSADSCK
jgi:hypothetical protein